MVRKRGRKACTSENEEIDSDGDLAQTVAPKRVAEPRKYSLRQRKKSIITDYDYSLEDNEDEPPPKRPSDDEDFEVDEEELAVFEAECPIEEPDAVMEDSTKQQLDLDATEESEFIDNSTFINTVDPGIEELPENPDELIDFEDVIRADIVVNKNRIDYDNIIEKTEIKIQPNLYCKEEEFEDIKPKTRRGRRSRKIKKEPEQYFENYFENGYDSSDDLPLSLAILRKCDPGPEPEPEPTVPPVEPPVANSDTSSNHVNNTESTNTIVNGTSSETVTSSTDTTAVTCTDKTVAAPDAAGNSQSAVVLETEIKENQLAVSSSTAEEKEESASQAVQKAYDLMNEFFEEQNKNNEVITEVINNSNVSNGMCIQEVKSMASDVVINCISDDEDDDDVILIEQEHNIIVLDD